MTYTCDECGGDVHVSLTGWYCYDCGETWEFLSPENRERTA